MTSNLALILIKNHILYSDYSIDAIKKLVHSDPDQFSFSSSLEDIATEIYNLLMKRASGITSQKIPDVRATQREEALAKTLVEQDKTSVIAEIIISLQVQAIAKAFLVIEGQETIVRHSDLFNGFVKRFAQSQSHLVIGETGLKTKKKQANLTHSRTSKSHRFVESSLDGFFENFLLVTGATFFLAGYIDPLFWACAAGWTICTFIAEIGDHPTGAEKLSQKKENTQIGQTIPRQIRNTDDIFLAHNNISALQSVLSKGSPTSNAISQSSPERLPSPTDPSVQAAITPPQRPRPKPSLSAKDFVSSFAKIKPSIDALLERQGHLTQTHLDLLIADFKENSRTPSPLPPLQKSLKQFEKDREQFERNVRAKRFNPLNLRVNLASWRGGGPLFVQADASVKALQNMLQLESQIPDFQRQIRDYEDHLKKEIASLHSLIEANLAIASDIDRALRELTPLKEAAPSIQIHPGDKIHIDDLEVMWNELIYSLKLTQQRIQIEKVKMNTLQTNLSTLSNLRLQFNSIQSHVLPALLADLPDSIQERLQERMGQLIEQSPSDSNQPQNLPLLDDPTKSVYRKPINTSNRFVFNGTMYSPESLTKDLPLTNDQIQLEHPWREDRHPHLEYSNPFEKEDPWTRFSNTIQHWQGVYGDLFQAVIKGDGLFRVGGRPFTRSFRTDIPVYWIYVVGADKQSRVIDIDREEKLVLLLSKAESTSEADSSSWNFSIEHFDNLIFSFEASFLKEDSQLRNAILRQKQVQVRPLGLTGAGRLVYRVISHPEEPNWEDQALIETEFDHIENIIPSFKSK